MNITTLGSGAPLRALAAAAFGLCLSLPGWAQEADAHAMHDMHDMHHMHDMHDMHHMATPQFKVSQAQYTVPDVKLVRADGRTVSLPSELDDGRPVVLNFIYTTCQDVCPMMSQSFMQFQDEEHADRRKIHMVSISIDPEQDTPPKLREYAQRFRAGPQWDHYTGTVAASVAAQQAFNTYGGDKMAHDPLTLMRLAPGQPWMRIDGFTSGRDLARQFALLTQAAH